MSQYLAVACAAISLCAWAPPAFGQDRVEEGQWFHRFLNTSAANAIATGNGIVVAVIDSGVDNHHPDLAGRILSGIDLVPPSDGASQPDIDGHGTAMAGLIVANGRIKGVTTGAKVLPVRAALHIEGPVDRLALGVRRATANGVGTILISQGTTDDDLLLRQEVEAAIRADVVVVAAVGNLPDHQRVQYPAAIPGVLAVAGVDKNGNRSRISVAGPEVDIAAPSDNISSTDKGGGYREGTGTSDAAAIVAGAVALVRAKYPELKGPEVVRRLTATATDKGAPGRDDEYGYGVLNIVAALTAVLPAETPTVGSSGSGVGAGGATAPGEVGRGGLAWWLLAVLPATAVAIVGVTWLRRRRNR